MKLDHEPNPLAHKFNHPQREFRPNEKERKKKKATLTIRTCIKHIITEHVTNHNDTYELQ